ncbi:preprotein translocase subunit SecE [Bacillus sp. NTK071]|uniref:preprotein translocase subunit SecE n=1 Tax=Bacillus sp. NTK071 TaxID=2802175 RepID=UPI001A8D6A14|nr:preprotein translocase subunit SecE [Bacillus sp. NTK071]MBN8210769.1 preprotein translocase subunit SecE [Bacillus sp. NTK071]
MASIVQRSGKFFRNVASEMKRVSWPTRKELTRYTIVTVTTVIFIAVFFALVDQGISSLIRLILG